MYINTTENVRNLIENLTELNDIKKLKFLIYLFEKINNMRINDINEANPNLVEDNDMKIFTLESIELPYNICTTILDYFVKLYNDLTEEKKVYEDNGNVIGINYDDEDKKICSQFERLEYNEKLDVISEIIIRYDNETYFNEKEYVVSFDSNLNGFDLAHLIQQQKL